MVTRHRLRATAHIDDLAEDLDAPARNHADWLGEGRLQSPAILRVWGTGECTRGRAIRAGSRSTNKLDGTRLA